MSDADGCNTIDLPDVYVQNKIPVNHEDLVTKEDVEPWQYLHEITVPELPKHQQVDLLIGNNVPRALEPVRVIQSIGDGPYAVQTALGWEIHGMQKLTNSASSRMISVHRVTVEDVHNNMIAMYNHDFSERVTDDVPQPSLEDQRFMDIVSKSARLVDGHYEIALPLKDRSN